MARKEEAYVVTMRLVRDPRVPDNELVRSLSDWKRLKDEGRKPPKWNGETPTTLEGFIRLLANSGPAAISTRRIRGTGRAVECAALFTAATGWTDIMAQAMSFIAFGLKPGSHLDVACQSGRRRFGIALNGDGEQEVVEEGSDG